MTKQNFDGKGVTHTRAEPALTEKEQNTVKSLKFILDLFPAPPRERRLSAPPHTWKR